MSPENTKYFTKETLLANLKELAKEYRKLGGKSMPAEIVLVGGAAVVANYGFREMTTDVDAVIRAASSMKDAINRVGDRFGLPNGWLNADFLHTGSYSKRLDEFSVYWGTFSNVLTVRTIRGEYLIAMKLRSGRQYKNDMSDIVGVLKEHQDAGDPITMDRIDAAVIELYGGWDDIPPIAKKFLDDAIRTGNYAELYQKTVESELDSKDLLVFFEADYPGAIQESNVNDILQELQRRKKPSPGEQKSD